MSIDFKCLTITSLKYSAAFFSLSLLSFSQAASISTPKHNIPHIRYFNTIKKEVFAEAYTQLPYFEVKREHFKQGQNNILFEHGVRTLASDSDLLDKPLKQKLLQANGICFSGYWHMAADSPYSGLYAANTVLPVIVRMSVSLSGTEQQHKRAMGMAVKVFHDTASPTVQKTSNFFVMHSLGGIKTRHVYDLVMDNEPELGSLPPFRDLLTAKQLETDLKKADKQYSGKLANARFRPVSHLARVDATGKPVTAHKAPHWLQLAPAHDSIRIDRNDFRQELNVDLYPNQRIQWQLSAAQFNTEGKKHATWQHIGELVVDNSVVSPTCDTRLHFQHPSITP